ncbi:MAG: 30S ribosomal protein S9 [Butyricicoccus sp.]
MLNPRQLKTPRKRANKWAKFLNLSCKCLKINDFLMTENQKYGLKAARRAPQFSKR